jgi:hypothetical protein
MEDTEMREEWPTELAGLFRFSVPLGATVLQALLPCELSNGELKFVLYSGYQSRLANLRLLF